MRTCDQCERAMRRDVSTGAVRFVCVCGVTAEGGPGDARIAGGVFGGQNSKDRYRRLIASSAFDPVNQKVRRRCPKCPRDFLTQLRIGQEEVVVWTCTCGYNSADGPPPGELAEPESNGTAPEPPARRKSAAGLATIAE